MKFVKNIFIFFILINFIFLNNAWSTNASSFINSLTNQASEILSSKLSDEEKITKLKIIGENSVDIDGVGLYTLGNYRKILTDDQKDQYKKLFRERVRGKKEGAKGDNEREKERKSFQSLPISIEKAPRMR